MHAKVGATILPHTKQIISIHHLNNTQLLLAQTLAYCFIGFVYNHPRDTFLNFRLSTVYCVRLQSCIEGVSLALLVQSLVFGVRLQLSEGCLLEVCRCSHWPTGCRFARYWPSGNGPQSFKGVIFPGLLEQLSVR